MALYRAKSDGRGVHRFFEEAMDAKIRDQRALETELTKALANDEFEVVYQPLVSIAAREVVGFEALLRWHSATRGLVLPGVFIPVLEEIGLINEVGAWVLKKACTDAMQWPTDAKIAVNLSPVQFKTNRLGLDVCAALASSGLPAQRLELEITETAMLQDATTTLTMLRELKALGLAISLDDFGTGYSSLSYLQKFPFDKIKIDQSFVRELPTKEESLAIVRAIIRLADSLGMTTLAEGDAGQHGIEPAHGARGVVHPHAAAGHERVVAEPERVAGSDRAPAVRRIRPLTERHESRGPGGVDQQRRKPPAAADARPDDLSHLAPRSSRTMVPSTSPPSMRPPGPSGRTIAQWASSGARARSAATR